MKRFSNDDDLSTVRLNRRSLMAGGIAAFAGMAGMNVASAEPLLSYKTIDRIIDRMTLEEKIGQMFIIQVNNTSMTDWYRNLLLEVQPGGVLFFGFNVGSFDEVRNYIDAIQRTGRYAPPLIAVDQEGGPVARVPGDPVPGATQLGQMPDTDVRKFSIDRAKFLREYGFNVNFAPVADVAYSPTSTMISRAFGSDPDLVSEKITAVVSGSRRGKIASAAKHFPGHGRTSVDSHSGLPVVDVSLDEWLSSDAKPFEAAISVGVEMIMLGHLLFPQWDTLPTTFSSKTIDVLRNDLGFRGVILTDDLVMGAMQTYTPEELIANSIAAGMDMVMYTQSPVPLTELIAHTKEKVLAGDLSEDQIDASVRRILILKSTWFPHLAIPLA
ncbi:MAG: glycoside hydrolase family 3 protein [Thermomicrobiales bacterium]|nr:glycoside hydrolase family 3 protein [Thermomicrobiales bacterium]